MKIKTYLTIIHYIYIYINQVKLLLIKILYKIYIFVSYYKIRNIKKII